MLTVNYTYGILTGGVVPVTSSWYRGVVGEVSRNKIQKELLNALWENRNPEAIGIGTDFLISLMRCSEYWPNYISKYDSVNTYDTKVGDYLEAANRTDLLTYDNLLGWIEKTSIPTSEEYRAGSSQVEFAISCLFSVLTAKDGR